MAGRLFFPNPALDTNGDPINGAEMHTYIAGTTVDRATYTTSALDVLNANPLVADAAGRWPEAWAAEDMAFRLVSTDIDFDVDEVYPLGASTDPAPLTKTSTYAVTSEDRGRRIEMTGAWTLTLPLGANVTAGFCLRLANTGTGTITVTPSGSDTADIASVRSQEIYDVVWSGSNWEADYVAGGQGRKMIPIVASAMRAQNTNGAPLTVAELSTNKQMIASRDFDASTQEYAQFAIPMPQSWDEGAVYFEAVWSHGSTTTNFGVAFSLQALAYADDDALDAAWGTAVTVTDTGGTTNDHYVTPLSAAVTIAGTPAAGDTVYFRVSREVANAGDTMAVDAKLLAIRLYVLTNAPTDAA
jgi:hypothetical protein